MIYKEYIFCDILFTYLQVYPKRKQYPQKESKFYSFRVNPLWLLKVYVKLSISASKDAHCLLVVVWG